MAIKLEDLSKEERDKLKKEAYGDQLRMFAKKLESSIAENEIVRQKKKLFSTQFNSSTVQQYLEDPQKNEKELRLLSTVLYTLSPQYQRIMRYLPSICRFMPLATPRMEKFTKGDSIDEVKLLKQYNKIISDLDRMCIQHEFSKIAHVCVREDIFYGYEYDTKDSYYIRRLDSDYCRISSVEDGCFNFAFDFSYFDTNKKLTDITENLVETFPEEFQRKYKLYKADSHMKWQELDSDKTICIKFLEDVPFVFPPFANLFDDIADINDYKSMNKSATKVGSTKFIGMTIPTLNGANEADDFAVDPDTAMSMYQMLVSNLKGTGIGAFLSATPFQSIDFGSNSTSSDKNNISDAENSMFASSGISPVNFGKGADTGSTLTMSNENDQWEMFCLYDQLERWLNRKFKKLYNNSFTIELLRVGKANLEKERQNTINECQYGVPNKLKLAVLSGQSQQKERAMSKLEELLDLQNSWKPLNSSYTTSGNSTDEGGRPEVDESEITDAGQNSKDYR